MIIYIVVTVAWLLIIIGLHLFMREGIRLESVESVSVRATERVRSEGASVVREHRKQMLVALLLVDGLVALLLVLLLWF